MHVVLPAPFGPRKPWTRPLVHLQVEARERETLAVALRQADRAEDDAVVGHARKDDAHARGGSS